MRQRAKVREALAAAYVPTHILGQYVKGSRVSTPDDHTVVTALVDENGMELMRFVTTVTPDGEGSEVSTEVLTRDLSSGKVHRRSILT